MAIHLLASCLITENAFARISAGERKTNTPTDSSGGNNGRQASSGTKISEGSKDDYQTVIANTAICNSDINKEKYFPLSFFNEISRDENAGIQIQKKTGSNKILVKIPPIINVCGQFTPEFRQDKNTKNVTVLMKLYGTKKEKVTNEKGETVVKETKDTLLTHQEFEECLSEAGIFKDNKIDWDKVPSNGYSESLSSFDYDFDKKKDAKKTVSITYGYPKSYESANGYKPLFDFDNSATVLGESCMRAEMVADKKLYLNEGTDVLIEKLNAACDSGIAQEIAAARRSIGNAEALNDIADKLRAELDVGYLIAVKKDVDRIDVDMKKIEDKLNKEKDTLDEAGAKKLISKYAELAKELNTLYLDPAIMRLDSLMQKRATIGDDESPEVVKIDEEIKKLNEGIAQFAKRNPTSFASVYGVMEKFAITDSAKVIEDIRLKSYLYSKVYPGKTDEKRGKQMTFDMAEKKQYEQLQKFDRTLTDWTDIYLVGQGNTFPIKKVERERQGTIDRMNSRWAAYEKKEYTDYNNYCAVGMLGSVKNPVKCKEWSAGLEKRRTSELKKREKDLLFVRGRNDKLDKMGTNYNEHQRRMASRDEAEADGYEPYGSSYTSYEDNFSDRFPGYYGPTSTTAYNGANYNMGGVSGSMQMGQQQYQMPQQQYQAGQYQMPQQQQQQGGWPGL